VGRGVWKGARPWEVGDEAMGAAGNETDGTVFCSAELFPTAPLFAAGQCRSWGLLWRGFALLLFAAGELERQSETAHALIGGFLLLLVLVWTGHVVKWPSPLRSLRTSYAAAGAVSCCGGGYLFLWVLVLLKPSQLGALWAFTKQALTQIQHISIALNLLACGATDLAVAYGAVEDHFGKSIHSFWALNLTCVGLVFMVHPQSTSLADTEHLVLGLCIILGTYFLSNERRDAWPPDSIEALIGAPLFGVAVAILMAFEEQDSPFKVLAESCQTGYRLAWVGGLVALVTTAAVGALSIWARASAPVLQQPSARRSSQSPADSPGWRGRARGRYEMVPTDVEVEAHE